jgi:hypothetical protein
MTNTPKQKEVRKKKADYYISLEGDRIYLISKPASKVSFKIDVTPLWYFFKQITNH